MSRILITGGAGFIGSHLADHHLAHGDQVLVVDNLLTGRRENVPDAAEFHHLDILDRANLYELANSFKPTQVFHCAASYSDPQRWHRDAEVNVLGTINAVLVAQHHKADLVYFQTALPPISSYAISKIAALHYVQLGKPSALTLRLANMYGPRNVSGPIPAFYRRLRDGEPCMIVRSSRDFVYIDDLIDAVTTLRASGTAGVVDIASDRTHTIRKVYEAVWSQVGGERDFEEVDPDSDDVTAMVLDPTAVKATGWEPKTSLEDGVAAAIDWYRENQPAETYTHLRS